MFRGPRAHLHGRPFFGVPRPQWAGQLDSAAQKGKGYGYGQSKGRQNLGQDSPPDLSSLIEQEKNGLGFAKGAHDQIIDVDADGFPVDSLPIRTGRLPSARPSGLVDSPRGSSPMSSHGSPRGVSPPVVGYNSSKRQGDWFCICGAHNYSMRTTCIRPDCRRGLADQPTSMVVIGHESASVPKQVPTLDVAQELGKGGTTSGNVGMAAPAAETLSSTLMDVRWNKKAVDAAVNSGGDPPMDMRATVAVDTAERDLRECNKNIANVSAGLALKRSQMVKLQAEIKGLEDQADMLNGLSVARQMEVVSARKAQVETLSHLAGITKDTEKTHWEYQCRLAKIHLEKVQQQALIGYDDETWKISGHEYPPRASQRSPKKKSSKRSRRRQSRSRSRGSRSRSASSSRSRSRSL